MSSAYPKLGSVLNALDIGVIVVDEHGRVVVWNDWIGRVARIPSQTAIGKTLAEINPQFVKPRLAAAIEDALRVGSSSILTHTLNENLPLLTDEGNKLLHNIVVQPVWSEDTRNCLLQIDDVTLAVSRERVLRERQNARYHAIVDSAPDVIITMTLDRTIQWSNGAVANIFGYQPSELIEKKLDVLLAGDTAELENLAALAGQKGSGRTAEVVGRRKDGSTALFDVSFARWRADERAFITTIWRDLTQRISVEVALRHSEEALRRTNEELESRVSERTREREIALGQLYEAQKMETIGQLTGGVAHDFNNLLAVILGSLALLKKSLPPDARTARLIDNATQGAERGATLTKRLLAFARRQELKLEAVELQRLIPEMTDFLRQSVGPEIAVKIEIRPDVAPVKIDVNQLELALMNLAVNSRDAMPSGGTLTIDCENEIIVQPNQWALPSGDYVRISVRDTGEGMDAATLARATEPFFTTKGVGKGTGLGLSMVQGLTAQSGGATQIVSAPGEGTLVSLWLPRARPEDLPRVADAPMEAAPTLDHRLRILLVDDDALINMNTSSMLEDLGHEVVENFSGTEALATLAADAAFDLVITDYAMPGMTGLDLAMRAKEANPHLAIVLATGYAEVPGGAPIAFPRLGKPYTQDQLARAIDAATKPLANAT